MKVMNDPHLKRAAILIVLAVAILAIGSLYLFARPAPSAPVPPAPAANPVQQASATSTGPSITWAPASLTETILAGISTTVPVSFSVSQNTSNVVLRVVPELQPFIQVAPSSFAAIASGPSANVNLTFSAPPLMLPQAVTGTIQLRNQSDPNATLARPLPVTINVTWQSYADSVLGFTLTYPPTFVPVKSADPNLKQVTFSDSQNSLQGAIAPTVLVDILDLPQGQSLRDFVHSFGVDDTLIQELTIGGRLYLKWVESAGDGIESFSYSTLFSPNQVITVSTPSASFASSSAFAALVSSLNFPPQ